MKHFLYFLLFLFTLNVQAKDNVELIVASSPGGSVHKYALAIQPIIEKALNKNVIINFKPGGNGIIAARELLNSTPNQNSFLIGNFNSPDIWRENFKEHQIIDVRKDIKPVVFLGTIPSMVYSRPNENYKDFRQALNYGKKQKMTMALAANTPNNKLMKDIIQKHSDSEFFITVPFKTGSLGLLSVLGEHVDTGVTVIDVLVPEIKNNRIRPLALIYENRLKTFSDVPTLRELNIIVDNEDRYYNNFFLWSNTHVTNEVLEKVRNTLFKFLSDKDSEELRNSLHIQFGKNEIRNPEKYMEELLK